MIIRVESEGERTELSSNKEPFQLQDEQGHMNLVAGLVYIHMNFLILLYFHLSGQQSDTSSRLLYDGLPRSLGSARSYTLRSCK